MRISCKKLINELSNRGIQWYFHPPNASHRGGVWERMIRSVRRILHAISQQPVCDEVLQTLVTEAERIVNNRPLIPCYDDRRNLPALSPSDFLLLRPIDTPMADCKFDASGGNKPFV